MKPDGGSAFPHGPNPEYTDERQHSQTGMKLRDYFAAAVISQYLVNYTTLSAAEAAYEMADAMLAERNK